MSLWIIRRLILMSSIVCLGIFLGCSGLFEDLDELEMKIDDDAGIDDADTGGDTEPDGVDCADDNELLCGGECVDITDDPDHCGGCGAGYVCEGATPYCLDGQCVACIDDGDCEDGLECDDSTNSCSGCEYDGECGQGFCRQADQVCVACIDDENCEEDQVCDEVAGACRNCLDGDDDCDDGEVCVEEGNYFCADCLGPGHDEQCQGTEFCTSDFRCVECLQSSDCSDDSDVCDSDGRCVDCITDDHCGNPDLYSCVANTCSDCDDPRTDEDICLDEEKVCGIVDDGCGTSVECNLCDESLPLCDLPNETCVECLDSNDCGDDECDPDTNQCVECLDGNHCAPGEYCTQQTNECVECLSDSDCTNGICLDDQICSICDPNAEPFGSGEGTESDPFLLCAPSHLEELANSFSSAPWEDMFFLLIDDIDMFGSDMYHAGPFRGHFDGNGKTIRNLWASTGLFSEIGADGTVESVHLDAVDVSQSDGFPAGSLAGLNRGEIRNCQASDASVSNVTINSTSLGGLVGENEGVIIDSSARGVVSGYYEAGYSGGLVGRTSGNSTIERSFSTANTSGRISGGLVGQNDGGTIVNSYALGDVEGNYVSGGLVGRTAETFQCGVTTSITNSYAAGEIVDADMTIDGGLMGGDCDASIYNSYWDQDTSKIDNSNGGDPLRTTDFANDDNFSSWDFSQTWVIDEALDGHTRPVLQWQQD